jgi:hypothetical protein
LDVEDGGFVGLEDAGVDRGDSDLGVGRVDARAVDAARGAAGDVEREGLADLVLGFFRRIRGWISLGKRVR